MSERIEYWKLAGEPVLALSNFSKSAGAKFPYPTIADLVVTRVSQINGCGFCLDMHWREAMEHGENPQRLAVLGAWREVPSFFTEQERAALDWAEALTRLPGATAADHEQRHAALKRVREVFTDTEVSGLGYVIAGINAWNRLAVGFEREVAKR